MSDVIGLLGPGILLAAPILYAAIGGLFTYRAGIFNIGLEGFMLISAYFSIVGAMQTHSLLLGTLIGVLAAALAAAVMGVAVVAFRADEVIVGIAINLFALGLTTFLLSDAQTSGQSLDLPSGYPQFHIGLLDGVPVLDQIFNNRDVIIWLMIPLVIGVNLLFRRTSFGLHLKATGEAPLAARAAGVRVSAVRFASVVLSGVLCGVGGAELSIGSVHLFSENMTSGRGIIAFAAVIFGAGLVGRVSVACLLFGLAQALAGLLQIKTNFPSQFVLMVPYLVTIVAVGISDALSRRRRYTARGADPGAGRSVAAPLVLLGHLTVDEIHMADGAVHPATIGGAAAYAAMGASLAGGDVCVVSRVGDDYPLARLADVGEGCGAIDAGRTARLEGRSIHNTAFYDVQGLRHYDIEDFDTLIDQTPSGSDLGDLDLAGRWALISPATLRQQADLIEELSARGAQIALDTELHYLTERDALDRLVELTSAVDCFLPSREHIAHLTGYDGDDPNRLAEVVAVFDCPLVVVKCGAAGVQLVDRHSTAALRVPAVPALVILDPTGAGDAFDGGLLVGLSQGKSPGEAAAGGCVAASFVVESIGVCVPPTYSAIERARRTEGVTATVNARVVTTHREVTSS